MQIVHSSRRGSRDIGHIGSAHDDAMLEALNGWRGSSWPPVSRSWDLGLDLAAPQSGSGAGGGPLAITSSRMAHQ